MFVITRYTQEAKLAPSNVMHIKVLLFKEKPFRLHSVGKRVVTWVKFILWGCISRRTARTARVRQCRGWLTTLCLGQASLCKISTFRDSSCLPGLAIFIYRQFPPMTFPPDWNGRRRRGPSPRSPAAPQLPGNEPSWRSCLVFAGFHEISGLCARLDGDKLTFRDTFSEWHAAPTSPGIILATTT